MPICTSCMELLDRQSEMSIHTTQWMNRKSNTEYSESLLIHGFIPS